MKCLFCGKPLSRISLRREGDFCCREHRDRYHLRQGISRVQEAHEISQMTRRRECPSIMRLDRVSPGPASPRLSTGELPAAARDIRAALVPSLRAGTPKLPSGTPHLEGMRGARPGAPREAAHPPAIRPPLAVREPHTRRLSGERAAAREAGFRNPAMPAAASAATARHWDTRLPASLEMRLPRSAAAPRRTSRKAAWQHPQQPVRTGARRRPAPSARARSHAAAPLFPELSATRQRCAMPPALSFTPGVRTPLPSAERRTCGPAPAAFSAPRPPAPASLTRGGFPQAVPLPVIARPPLQAAERRACSPAPATFPAPRLAVRERAVRCGFPSAARFAAVEETPAAEATRRIGGAAAPWSQTQVTLARASWAQAGSAVALPPAAPLHKLKVASPPGTVRKTAAPAAEPRREPACPVPARQLRRARPPAAAFMPVQLDAQDRDAAAGRALHPFHADAKWLDAAREATVPAAPPLSPARRPRSSGHCSLAGWPATAPGTARAAAVPFPTHAVLLRSAHLPILGTVAGTLEDTRSGGAFHMEENFSGGLAQWTGGTVDWRLDAAGVRPCSLAVFSPSLEARDYVLEFLARLEQGSLSWAFRLAGLENYYAIRIALAPGPAGPVFQMSRHAVICGTPEPPVSVPVPVSLRSRAAFRVQVRAVGSQFTTELDGHVVDRWTDDRLPAGGIGFQADRDARARLYWVKLSSPAPSAPAITGHLSPEPHGSGLE